MTKSKFQGQERDSVFLEVVIRQLHCAVEDREHTFSFQFLWLGFRSVTLEAERIAIGSKQLWPVATMGIVASRAALAERGLVQKMFLGILSPIRVAVQANAYGIRLRESGRFASVWAVAIRAVSHRAGMLNFRSFYFLGLFRMASGAQFLGAGLGQNHFAILCRLVADFALLLPERKMHEPLHQLGPIGLMRIVARKTVGFLERLVLVGFGKGAVFRVVTVQAKGG